MVGHGQAANSLYHALVGLPAVRFQWVIGRRLDSAAQFASERGIPNHSIQFEAALADPTVDTMLICSPNELHYSQAMQALQAGKHVVVEVPMAMSYREAQALVNTAAEKGLFLSVPHTGRYLTTARQAKALLASGELGHPYQLIYRRLVLLRPGAGWTGRPRSWIDSVSWHHGAHALDLASWLLGEPLHCVGAAIGHNASHHQSTDVSAVLVTPSKTIVTVTISYNSTQRIFDCVVVGEKGMLALQDFTSLRHDDAILIQELDPFESLERAYRSYALDLVASLRGEGPVAIGGAELLPMMEQLDHIHTMAGEPGIS
jgi:2-hydroxy-4-carboxymuconate semialdehyde hemiacetal dehydrogenase